MHDFQLKLSDLTFTGSALDRPECVLATAAGDLFTSDARGGVVHIRPDGTQQLIVGKIPGGGQAASERLRDAARRLVPHRQPRRRPGRGRVAAAPQRAGRAVPARSRRHHAAAHEFRAARRSGPRVGLDQHRAQARLRVQPDARRRLHRAGGQARRAHRGRRDRVDQRVPHQSGRHAHVFQRDLGLARLALPPRARTAACRTRKSSRSSGPATIPTASPSTSRAARGSPASSPTG